jgi:hypothetical protein
VHNYKQVYLKWIICIFIQIIFINIQNLPHKTLSCKLLMEKSLLFTQAGKNFPVTTSKSVPNPLYEVSVSHKSVLSEIKIPTFRFSFTDMQCITDSDIFISNCLNRHVLHISMYEFLENVGPFDDNEPLNECVIIFQHFRVLLYSWKEKEQIWSKCQWENIPYPMWLADQKQTSIGGHTIFNNWDTPQNTASPKWPPPVKFNTCWTTF